MRVLLYTYGTRGDVEPYLALACALGAAGHQAIVSAPACFQPAADGHGVRFVGRDNEFLDLMTSPPMQTMLAAAPAKPNRRRRGTTESPLGIRMRDHIFPAMLAGLVDAAADGADLVVHKYDHAHHIAEWLGVPSVLGLLHPHYVPSWHYPSSMELIATRTSRTANRLSHVRSRVRGEPEPMREIVERWRCDRLGLRPRRRMHDRMRRPDGGRVPVLHGFSPHLVPPAPDWPSSVRTTGFWALPQVTVWTPPPALARFLAEGDPPVFFGFGSLTGSDPRRTGRIVRDVVARTGVRAVVVAGAGAIEIPDPSADIAVVDDVPYDWLFPRTRAVVHAGGLGTSHYALVAGRPQVACPFHAEQMGWSRRLQRLGVAPPPIWHRDLTIDGLTAAVERVLIDSAMTAAAERAGWRIRAERGVDAAVEALEIIDAHGRRSVL